MDTLPEFNPWAGVAVLVVAAAVMLAYPRLLLLFSRPESIESLSERHERLDAEAFAATTVPVEEAERCDICLAVLTDDNAVITCDAHRYCVACDDDSNRCTACSFARGLAVLEERA